MSDSTIKTFNRTQISDEELRERLNPMQYEVTQNGATEMAFFNEFWDNDQHGLYVDIVSGEPLFSSLDKLHSSCGWPSFSRPVEMDHVTAQIDDDFMMTRVEVRSKAADSHLGHVFDDGPMPTGMRFCINSAALRFIPIEDLEAEGYGHFLERFTHLVISE